MDTTNKNIRTHGIHHVSSIVGHAQENIDFNAGVLGQRLVKQTLNFDDRYTYHFYFGNHDGTSGLTTTFPMQDSTDGKMGGGQVEVLQYAIKPGQLTYWNDRLASYGIVSIPDKEKGTLRLKDPVGLNIEMIEKDIGPENKWSFNQVSGDQQIIGIESVRLLSRNPDKTLNLFTDLLGYKLENEDDDTYKLRIHNGLGGTISIAKDAPPVGLIGVGSVHHVALAVKNDEVEAWIPKLESAGFKPTEVKNRKYFRSIYFREKGGILIELATEGPGVLIDEDLDNLGKTFLVPPHFEDIKDDILEDIMPVEVREVKALGHYTYRNRYEYDLVQKRAKIRAEIQTYSDKEGSGQLSAEEKAKLTDLRKQFVSMK